MTAKGKATGLERLSRARVAIWGPGVEGAAVAKAALERGAKVTFIDDAVQADPKASAPLSVEMDGEKVEVEVRSPAALVEERFECLVRTPGVSVYRPELVSVGQGGMSITSATEMWLEDFAGSRIVGVTGTKGKTTTAWLTAILLEASGTSVGLAGNMGTPVTSLYENEPSDAYVVELSSFQAADVTVSPRVGVLTLLAPDHLDWHRTYENYVRDKLNLFAHRRDIALAVNSSSAEATKHTDGCEGRRLYGPQGRVTSSAGGIAVDGVKLVDSEDVPLRGEHNLVNLCGALTACLLVGAELPQSDALVQALQKMPVLPSRLQTVATHGGVEYVNDALASNPAGAVAALRTFAGRRVVMIVGGQDRGVSLQPLVQEISKTRPMPVLVTLPDVGLRIEHELASSGAETTCVHAATLEEAVDRATELVGDEGVVLFAPAAPTPLVEGSYVQRGAVFNKAVERLEHEAPLQ
jgi:UDP-N-acetylmuramoylalanine--D-glutamate ligase